MSRDDLKKAMKGTIIRYKEIIFDVDIPAYMYKMLRRISGAASNR